MRLVDGVEPVRDLAEGEVVDLAAHVEREPAPADGEPAAAADHVLVGRAGGEGAPAARAQRDLGLGHDEGVGRGLDALEQQAEHEEGREARRPLGAGAQLQRGPERAEEGLRLLEQVLVQHGLDLPVEDPRRRRRCCMSSAGASGGARVRRRQEGHGLRLRLLQVVEAREGGGRQAELAREGVVRDVDGEGALDHGGLRAQREALGDGEHAARQRRAAVGVGHLLGVARLGDEVVHVLARAPPQRLALVAVRGVHAHGHRGARVQVQLVRADAHVPVLQHLGAPRCEEGRRDRQRRQEARARRQLDEVRLCGRCGGGPVELGYVVRDEACHHLLLKVTPDKAGEQHG